MGSARLGALAAGTFSFAEAALVFQAGEAGDEDGVNLDGQGDGDDDLVCRQPGVAGLHAGQAAWAVGVFQRRNWRRLLPRFALRSVRGEETAQRGPRRQGRRHTGACPGILASGTREPCVTKAALTTASTAAAASMSG